MRRGFALAVLALCPALAQAQAFRVESETETQVYHLRTRRGTDPVNPEILPRRRIVESLWLDGFELITGQDLGFEASVRVFDDFGVSRQDAATIEGVRALDADLLYANLIYRAGGFEARLGRQVRWDALEGFSMDGLRVRYLSPFRVGAEAYAGLWVKGQSFLGSATFQPDGTREVGVRTEFPETRLEDLEPVFGGRVTVEDLAGVSGALEYRRSLIASKVSLERAAAEVRYQRPGLGLSAAASADVDLVLLQLANVRALVRYDLGLLAATAEVNRLSPILTLDSIWYWFTRSPRDEASVRADLVPPGPARAYLKLTGTRFNQDINPALDIAQYVPQASAPFSLGGSAGASFALGGWHAAADFTFRRGSLGNSGWLDVSGGYAPPSGEYSADARLSYAEVRDGLQPLLAGRFWGAQVWASWALSKAARVSAVLEQNFNPLDKSDTKVFAVFQLGAGGRR